MNKRKDKGRLPPFVPLDVEVMSSPAWRATSFGARWLYMHLKRRWNFKQRNNGRIFLSQRDAQEEMGCRHRDSIGRWYRELQHYGFIVMTEPGYLGVDGKGKAPHWRLTEANWSGGRNGNTWMLPTKDYLKWDGTKFRDDQKQNPGPGSEARVAPEAGPVQSETGPGSEAISGTRPGPGSEAISSKPLRSLLERMSADEGGERSAPEGSAVASEPPENRKDRQQAENDIASVIGWSCLQEMPPELVEGLCSRWPNIDRAELFELKQKYEPPAAVGGQRARVAGAA